MSAGSGGVPRVLHIHGSLAAGNPQAERCVRLIEAFGARLRHTLVAADGDYGAMVGISQGVPIARKPDFPPFSGLPLPGRLQAAARAMVDYHLVLTYGRAGLGAALAHTSFGEVHALPPLIHHEDGSDETPAQRRGMRSRWLRRLGLGKAVGLVVPTERLEGAALVDWQQPLGRVKLIPDGIDLKRFGRSVKAEGIGRLLKRKGEHWIGAFPGENGAEGLSSLIDQLAALEANWHLVIVSDRPATGEFAAAVGRHALEHRVHFASGAPDRAAAIGLFDIVAACGGAEPMPLPMVEAAAAGKPIVALAPDLAAELLSADNADNADGGAGLLERLAGDPYLREAMGKANRERAGEQRDEVAMIASYRRLYASAMGRPTI